MEAPRVNLSNLEAQITSLKGDVLLQNLPLNHEENYFSPLLFQKNELEQQLAKLKERGSGGGEGEEEKMTYQLREVELMIKLVEIALPSSLMRVAMWKGYEEVLIVLISRYNIPEGLLSSAVSNGNMKLFNLLLEKGAPVDSPNPKISSPLMTAISAKNIQVVEELLKRGAKMRLNENDALITACDSSVEMVKLLIEKYGARVNSFLKNATPLSVACSKGNLEIVKCLLEHGADVNFESEEGRVYNRRMRFENTKRNPLIEACTYGNLDIAYLLINHGSKVEDTKGEYLTQPLHQICACSKQYMVTIPTKSMCEFIEVLALKGANLNAIRKVTLAQTGKERIKYETPLHISILYGTPEMMLYLVSLGGFSLLDTPYVYNNTTTSVFNLIKNKSKETLSALLCHWNPRDHSKYPKCVRDAIKSMLLVAKRQHWMFDKNIMHNIFSFIAFGWVVPKPEARNIINNNDNNNDNNATNNNNKRGNEDGIENGKEDQLVQFKKMKV